MIRDTIRLAALAALLAACGGGGDDDGGGGGSDGGEVDHDATPGNHRTTHYVANRAGAVELIEDETIGTSTAAWLRDRDDLPPATMLASQGACEIWTHPVAPASCDPACEDGYCIAEDECVPYPMPVNAGLITVNGLTEPVSFEFGDLGYQPDPSIPPKDLFIPDASVSAVAPGAGDVDGFSLVAQGVPTLEADLDLEFDVNLVIEDGVDREILWTAEDTGTIQLGLQVGWHGAAYEALLVCEASDDGSLTIPGDLISQFPRAANGMEQHSSWIARLTRDRVDTPAGDVELIVASQIRIPQLQHE